MSFCLPKFAADALKTKFKSGEISPETLSSMTSAERRALFEKIVGPENARQMNASFESKLLLKNQQAGMVTWAEQILGTKKELKRDFLSKVEKMKEVLSEKELDSFLNDYVEKKLGVHVPIEVAGKLVDLANNIELKKAAIKENSPINSPERIEYGTSQVLFKDLVSDLKIKGKAMKATEYLKPDNWGKLVTDTAGMSKSILSSLDNSFFGRQGIKTLFTYPDVWAKNFGKSWLDIGKELKGVDSSIPVKADVYSRPNAINGNYERMKLAVGIATEEAFPSSIPTRIPVLGRLFKASEAAYNNAALRLRADIADRVLEKAQKNGIDITDKVQAESLGKLVNSLTGRGGIGRLEVIGNEINAALFSVKYLKSNFDVFTAHALDRSMSGYARYQAAQNLMKIVSGVGGILATASALWPGSVETDPRSSDFAKIKIGNTRFDITGGMSSIVTLASRLISQSTKSSKTGKVTDLNSGKFGALNGMDVFYQFAEGKTSPALKALIDIQKGKNFAGDKPTFVNTMINLLQPLPVSTLNELLNDPQSADVFLSFLLSQMGIGVNTYGGKNK